MCISICSFCRGSSFREFVPRQYQYHMSGLDNIYLHGGVHQIECKGCGEIYTRIEAEGQLLEVIALSLLLKPAMLSGREMKTLRKSCLLSQDDLAAKLGVTRRAVLEREKKPNPGLKPEQELGLRAILFGAFTARQKRYGSNLDKKHAKMLEQAMSNFVTFAEKLKGHSKKCRATLTMDARKKQWRFEKPKAKAA